MNNKNLFIDVNVIQTVPSSNINRDDAGAPKTAIYGGVTRARVSSQSWKRAVRVAFKEETEDAEWLQSFRTMKAVELLADKIKELDADLSDEDAKKKSEEIFKLVGIKTKVDKNTKETLTKALLLVSDAQLEKVAKYSLENDLNDKNAKKEVKEALINNQSLDLALFGRMVADDPELNVDASSQVAHAISTHEIIPEFDYYTAVDDAKADDTSGSAMIGSIEYNSSTLYRYANVNINELVHNLGNNDLAIQGIKLFIKDFLLTMPTGKENTFANKTVPQYAMISIRQDTPVNLVSAFEEPVKSRDGYVEKSIQKLEEENQEIQSFVDKPLFTIALTNKESKIEEQADNLKDFIDRTAGVISQELANEDSND